MTIPMEDARGRLMARIPQINIRTPQSIDQPLAFLTEPRVILESILSFSFVCFLVRLMKAVHQYKTCYF